MNQGASERIIFSKMNETADEVFKSLLQLSREIVEASKPNAVFKETPEFMGNLRCIGEWLVDPDTKPGIMLGGLYGNGKTVTLRAIKELFHRCVVNKENHHIFFHSSTFVKAKEIAKFDAVLDDAIEADWLLIDEFGEEPTIIKDFGNSKAPIVDLIYYRYDKRKPTIITTNLNGDEMVQKYGGRVNDRMNDMFDKIIYKAESFRGL